MEAFVKQEFAAIRQVLPRGESPRRLTVNIRFFGVMNVVTGPSGTSLAVLKEDRLKLFKQIGLKAEMAKIEVAFAHLPRDRRLHPSSVISMEGVAFDKGCKYPLTTKDLLEGPSYRRGA